MKIHVFKFIAIAGLVAAMASPANAKHGDLQFAVRVGPAYVHYDDVYRHHDGHRRYGRHYRHRLKHKKRHHKRHDRQNYSHDLWHRYNDGRWDRYYDDDHRHLHHELRRGHRDFHRKQRRHR